MRRRVRETDRSGAAWPLLAACAALLLAGGLALALDVLSGAPPRDGVRPTGAVESDTAAQTGTLPDERRPAVGAAFAPREPAWLPVSDDEGDVPAAGPPAREQARTEAEHLARLRELAVRDPAALLAEGRRLLGPGGANQEAADCERVALLRAAYEARVEGAHELFRLAALNRSSVSTPRAVSLPDFVVGYLGERAASDARAREVLEGLAFGEERVMSGQRRRAAALLASCAQGDGLLRLHRHLGRETDPLLVEGVLDGLRRNPDLDGAGSILVAHGRTSDLAPDEEQREP